MATLKQRRRRFYILLAFIVSIFIWAVIPKQANHVDFNFDDSFVFDKQQTVFNQINVSVTPYLSNQKDVLNLVIHLESYDFPKAIHLPMTEIALVSLDDSDETLLSDGVWSINKKNEYQVEGELTYQLESPLTGSLFVRLYLIDELLLKWTINPS